MLGGKDFAPLKKIALKPGLGPLRFTPDGRHAMVVNTHEDLVHVLDVSSNELVHDIPVKGSPSRSPSRAPLPTYARLRASA